MLERDLTAETAKRVDDMHAIRETLGEICKGLAVLGENTSRELREMRKEISGLGKTIRKSGGR